MSTVTTESKTISTTNKTIRSLILLVITLALAIFALSIGSYSLTPMEVINALADPDAGFARTVVVEWRLPRVLLALLVGALLAISGALFQSLTDNSLGSPDIIGFTTGSYTGAIIVMLSVGTTITQVSLGALAGGLITAVVVMLLSFRGGMDSFRLIIVGIGVTAFLTAVNQWLLLRIQVEEAMSASIWGSGTLANSSMPAVIFSAIALVVLGVLVAAQAPGLRQLQLGNDLARAHGVRTTRVRVNVVLLGVALVAVAVAAAGPISFVALTAPPIAARLLGSTSLPLAGSGIVGAFIVLGADLVAQHVVGGIPVGTVTVVLGGGYLVLLLVREARKW